MWNTFKGPKCIVAHSQKLECKEHVGISDCVCGINRDVAWAETETKPKRSKFCPRRDRDETLQLPRRWPRPWSSRDSRESRELQRLAETFSVTYSKIHWQGKNLYVLINSHHGKRFLFVILWVFALYFDNYHWIIHGLRHKELQLQCCRHEPLCLSQFEATEISKLQLIITL